MKLNVKVCFLYQVYVLQTVLSATNLSTSFLFCKDIFLYLGFRHIFCSVQIISVSCFLFIVFQQRFFRQLFSTRLGPAGYMVAHVILVSPQSQLDLDLGLLWVLV